MADFRRWFYALAVVALLAGLTIPASAQQVPFTCNTNAGVPPIVRAEAYADLVGDLTLSCTGGTPTVLGNSVPQVNVTIFLSTNITSKLLGSAAGSFDEALLIVDEPNAAGPNSNRPILNCGAPGAADTGPSGPGVCSIISNGVPSQTYDGTTGVGYGGGRPNVFQGRLGLQQNSGQSNIVTFLGVPLDPPGTGTTRTLRITNVRADAEFVGVASTFQQLPIQMQISVNGNTSLLINNPQQVVAYVQRGLVASVRNPRLDFAQCNDENGGLYAGGSGRYGFDYYNVPQPAMRFSEGFASSWKEKNIAQHLANSTYSGAGYVYNGTTVYPPDLNQNVPGAIYNTESGFEYQPPPIGNPGDGGLYGVTTNPPPGIGNGPVTGYVTGYPFSSSTGTGIAGAGVATQGTRLAMSFQNIPQGSGVWVPPIVYLYRQGTSPPVPTIYDPTKDTGVAVLTATDASGNTPYSPYSGGNLVQVSNGLAVYEILYDDPFALEQVDIPLVVAYVANLSANPPVGLPATGIIAQVTGGFAPFYSTASARQPSSSLPVPRFVPGNQGPFSVYEINKCACDLLFPFVTNQGIPGSVFDTGIAVANTSLDPGATFGFFATPQQGAVQFWYYGVGANGSAPPPSQTSNIVPAGQVLTYVLSNGGGAIGTGPNGLDNRAAGFQGYMIAQAAFQYCHAFVFVQAAGALATSAGVSESYLGIVLDVDGLPRTFQVGENKAH